MSTFWTIVLVAGALAMGAIISWLVVSTHWTIRLATVTAQLESTRQKLEEQKAFFEHADRVMKDAFGSLAAQALHQNNQAFVNLAESKLDQKVTEAKGLLDGKERAIDGLVKPLAESLSKMDVKINELENKRERAYGNITSVLEGMQKSAQALDKGTQNLLSALKNSSTRGKYGEIGLRRVVEFAGMTEHCDFIEQQSVSNEDGTLRPDMVIHLPESKTIVVDSKTPLEAYMKIFETDSEAEKKAYLAQHAKAVQDHLKQLSAKAYWSQFSTSPDYVVLYMQIESSFGAALQTDPEMIEEAIRNNVIFATPTTLITLLRTVGFVWQQRQVAENIEQIRDTGIELFNRSTVLLRHFSNMGGSLKTAVAHYNSAVSSLESRFIPQAKKLYTLGSSYTKNQLPDLEQVELAVRNLESPDKEDENMHSPVA
jgi:DNA recombination protein RmuC